MKRVLFVHQSSSIGGGSYCLLNILREIDKTGIEPIACLGGDGPLREEIQRLGIEVILFPQMTAVPYNRSLWSLSSVIQYYKVKKSLPEFKRLLKKNKIDAVYLNNMMIYPYLKVAKECECRTILHCREHWPLDQHIVQLQWARNAVNKYCDALVAINKYSASIFSDNKDAVIVYDWIDMDSRYENKPLSDIFGEDMSGKKVYLFTGGVQRIKGTEEVIKAFVNNVKDVDARLLLVGISCIADMHGPISFIKKKLAQIGVKSYYYRILELIRSDDRIRCIPPTYMIAHIMQQCFCNLSYFTIPHANLALAECEIMKVPSIAADNEEAREYSRDGKLSLLYKAKDMDAFIKAITEMNAKHGLFMDALNCHSSEITAMFSKGRNVSKLDEIISKVMLN